MSKTKVPFQARQGDVFIERVKIPKGERKPVARDNGRIVLAYGESSGHAHAVCEIQGVEMIEVGGERLIVSETGFRLAHGNLGAIPTLVSEPIAAPLKIQGLAPGADHHAFAIPSAGRTRTSEYGYAVTIQKEYSPSEIRNVTD